MATLPPLAALRAFEAAARLESFSRAADEIHVTHGAVSHQVRALEAFVGVPLFTREGRGVVLTGDGRVLATEIRAALAQIGAAAQAIRRRAQSNRLTISVLPSFGSRWLMPRIASFMAAHPGWEINIDSSATLADFARDGIDVAVRFGRGPWPGLHSEWLMDDEYILVASPKLNRGRLPKRLDELARYPLLRADIEPWRAWCAAAGVDLKPPDTGVDYQDMGVMLQSAIEGQGIMLTRRAIATAELQKGTLVQIFDIAVPADWAYWIVWSEAMPASDRVLAFRDWMLVETAASRDKARKRRKPGARPK
ncbi:MAG: transcriptional regulator GcvA [Burkholderiaceae bacterium]